MANDHNKECHFDAESTETVFSCAISYIHQNDRNSVSLVSRKLYELDSITRKHVTINNCYSVPPSRLVKHFPYLESLKLKGYPKALMFSVGALEWGGYVTPWVKEIVNNLKWLECVKFKRMIVHDSDLKVLMDGCGEKLKVLKIEACSGFSTDGLLHIGRNCSGLITLCLQISLFDENGVTTTNGALLHTFLFTLSKP